MSERKINLDEIIFNHCENEFMDGLVTFHKDQLIKSYLEFGKQLLELAAENAKANYSPNFGICHINKQSILDTIKQVE